MIVIDRRRNKHERFTQTCWIPSTMDPERHTQRRLEASIDVVP